MANKEIRKYEFGSDDDELTHERIKGLPTADSVPKGSVKVSHKDPYYSEAHKNGYKVHIHNPSETAYLSKEDGKKEHERKHWK